MEVVLRNKDAFRKILKGYRPSPESISFLKEMDLVILQGITAAGRNTIINELVQRGDYYFIVSDTTRPPKLRNGVMEQNGVQYFFRTEEEVLADLKAGKFLEAELIHEQQVSGISIRELKRAKESGKTPIDEVDIIGPSNIRVAKPDVCIVFVLPPNFKEWRKRWASRETITEQEGMNRMRTAEKAIEIALSSEHYWFVVNDSVEHAADVLDTIVKGRADQEYQNTARATAEQLLEDLQTHLKSGTLDF